MQFTQCSVLNETAEGMSNRPGVARAVLHRHLSLVWYGLKQILVIFETNFGYALGEILP